MMRRRIPFAVAMLAAGILGAGCGGSSYQSDVGKVTPVAGVSITKTSTYLLVGNEELLVASVVPANADQRVQWSTSNDKIVSVTAVGKIKGVNPGTATIMVTTIDGGKVARCDVTVTLTDIPVTGITLDEPRLELPTGSARTLKATVAPANASNQALTWDIAPSGIANVAAAGNVATITGLKVGDATVTVTSLGNTKVSTSVPVKVTPVAVTGVALSQTALTLQAPKAGVLNGDALPLTATVAPTEASNKEVTWTTTDEGVASLTSTSGTTVTVVAHKQGTATITAKTVEGGFTQSCTVTVVPPPAVVVDVKAIGLKPTVVSLELDPATSMTIEAIIDPPDATNQNVYWTIDAPAVATIKQATGSTATGGSVSGSSIVVTAAGLGATKLTATTQQGGKQVMADVRVYMVDAEIPSSLPVTANFNPTSDPSNHPGCYDTKIGGQGNYQHLAIGKLVFYSDANGYCVQPSVPGINLNYYAAGGAEAKVGNTVPVVKSYIGINRAYTMPPPGTGGSLRITVTASAVGGTPTLALLEHTTGRVIDVKTFGAPPYVFDGVPTDRQLDIMDGAKDGSTINISHVRVEPSTTPVKDFTPPAEVTNPTATVTSATSLNLAWTNPTDADFASVEITSTPATTTLTIPKTASSTAVTGLTSGTTYLFTIKTVDTTGLKSAGMQVSGTPSGAPAPAALLDETFTQAVITAAKTSPVARITPAGSKLVFYSGEITWSGSFAYFNSWGVHNASAPYKWTASVGATPAVVKNYIAVPATVTSSITGSNSAKITIKAAQWQATADHHLVLLDATNKAIAVGPALASGGGATTPLLTFVVDGVRPNTEVRISSDEQIVIFGGVKVETSTTAITDTPTIVQQ